MSQTLKQDLAELKAKYASEDTVEITELDDETIEVTQADRVWTLSCLEYPRSTSVFCGEEQQDHIGPLVDIVGHLLEGTIPELHCTECCRGRRREFAGWRR